MQEPSSRQPDGPIASIDRPSAQARLDRIRAFSQELAALEQEGVATLEPEERRAIDDYHQSLRSTLTTRFDVDVDTGQRQMTVGMRIASVIGAIALCAAVCLFFYRIWGWISTVQQVAVLIAAPIVTVGATELAHRYDRSRHFLFIAGVIACASIVLNVTMVGRIFAMTDSPNALAVWAVFALSIGYGYRLRLAVAIGVATALVFLAGFVFAWRGLVWEECFRRPEVFLIPAAALFLAGAPARPSMNRFQPVYRIVGLLALLLALWSLSIDDELSALRWSATAIKSNVSGPRLRRGRGGDCDRAGAPVD